MQYTGRVIALSTSLEKGTPKTNVDAVRLVAEHGIDGDAHAGPWHRQVSLLAEESIAKIRAKGLDVQPGAFAENITTVGIEIWRLHPGDRIEIREAVLEVTQIGKECHHHCVIFQQVGDCVMPREGIFARVLSGGTIATGDEIVVTTAGMDGE